MRYYAIGDVHGRLSKLVAAHARIAADRETTGDPLAPVVHVGDLVDRGEDSRGVIDFLIAGQAEDRPWITLKGNHDRYLQLFFEKGSVYDPARATPLPWFDDRLGGAQTLESYGIVRAASRRISDVHEEALGLIPETHVAFLAGLPLMHVTPEILFVHAGIRPGVPLDRQKEDDLVWIREPFLSDTRDHGRLVVHGHTVVDAVTHYGNRLDIDTGAGRNGPVSAVVIEGRDVWLLTDDGRQPVRPVAA